MIPAFVNLKDIRGPKIMNDKIYQLRDKVKFRDYTKPSIISICDSSFCDFKGHKRP